MKLQGEIHSRAAPRLQTRRLGCHGWWKAVHASAQTSLKDGCCRTTPFQLSPTYGAPDLIFLALARGYCHKPLGERNPALGNHSPLYKYEYMYSIFAAGHGDLACAGAGGGDLVRSQGEAVRCDAVRVCTGRMQHGSTHCSGGTGRIATGHNCDVQSPGAAFTHARKALGSRRLRPHAQHYVSHGPHARQP